MKRLALFTFLFIFAFTLPSFADDIMIDNWNIDSHLLENGDLEVSEDLVFRFDDEFNGIFRDIVLDGTDGILDLEVYEVVGETIIPYVLDDNADVGDSNVYRTIMENNTLLIQVYSPSEDEEKTFRFSYKLENVAIIHEDTGEFYYKYLGEENETYIEHFTAHLSIPEFTSPDFSYDLLDDVVILVHGPLNGSIGVSPDGVIKFLVSQVKANNLIEGRVLYPKSYTPLSTRLGDRNLDDILLEEMHYEDSLNREGIRKEKIKDNFNLTSLIVAGLGTLLTGFLYFKSRRNPRLFDEVDSFVPEDISPAELSIFKYGAMSSRGITATIFDLARQDHIKIKNPDVENLKKKKTNLVLSKTHKRDASLLSHENYFLDWLFDDIGNGNTTSTKAISESRTKDSFAFYKNYQHWLKLVKEDLSKRAYYDKTNRKLGIFTIILSLAVLALGIISLVNSALYGIALLVLFIALLILGASLITRLSDKGFIQKGLWEDFKNEILGNNEILNENITDKELIYALALDLEVEDVNKYRSNYPDSYFPLYWAYFFMLNRNGDSILDDNISKSFYGHSSSSTYSGGSYGGFSAGGGGGAGGGGAGGF